jgi:hypothetical protein
MRQRRRRPAGRLGQEEERAEHKPPGSVSWLVLRPFLLLPAREARPTVRLQWCYDREVEVLSRQTLSGL